MVKKYLKLSQRPVQGVKRLVRVSRIFLKTSQYDDVTRRGKKPSFVRQSLRGDEVTRRVGNCVTSTNKNFWGPRWWQGIKGACHHLGPDFRHILESFQWELTTQLFEREKIFCVKNMTKLPDLTAPCS